MFQELFSNPLINNLPNIDWGRSVAPFNEMLIKERYKDQDVEDVVSTCAGYDLLSRRRQAWTRAGVRACAAHRL